MARWPIFWNMPRGASPVLAAATLLGLMMVVPPASAQLLTEYTTRIGPHDKVNSQGDRLDTVPAILRQDRANMHRFDLADDEDETDSVFDEADERGRFERLVARGLVRPDTRLAILGGNPLIRVQVYPTRVDVELVEP